MTKRICHFIVYALALYRCFEMVTIIPVEEQLTCNSGKCECAGTDLSIISCYFADESVHLPIGIPTHLRIVKIQGRNFSVYIPDQNYDDSWSLIESFEVHGDGGITQDLNLPYNFTRKLGQVKLFVMRNTGLKSIEEKSFMNMTVLEHLDLSQNKFLNIRYLELAMIQSSFRKLNLFNVSKIHSGERMSLYNIRPSLLLHISAIKNFDISWTRTASIKRLETLSSLETLNISGTPMLFDDQTCLKTVLLLTNLIVWRLNHWPRLMTNSVYLRHRRWQYPSLNVNPYSCSTVNVFRNECFILPPELKELYINHAEANEFYINFEEDVCIRSKLEHLSIRNLKVTGPIGIISGLLELKSIDISHTGFPFKSKIFHDMESLESVNASGNQLFLTDKTGFAELFIHNNNLKRVDLSRNEISEVPYNLFYQNSLLQSIDLSNNKLQYLNLNLTVCKSLLHLSLSNNFFKHIGGEGKISLEFVPTHHILLTISEISTETGLTCKCMPLNNKNRHWTKTSNLSMIENECNGAIANKNNADVSLISCSSTVPEDIASSSKSADKQSKVYLTIGISIPVCALGISLIIVIIIIRRRHSRKITEAEEYSLQEEIVLPESDRETIDDSRRERSVPDHVYFIGLSEASFKTSASNRNPNFAAFLAYSHEDRDFVINKLYGPLQKQLCDSFPDWNEEFLTVLYDKNFLPGQCTMDVCRTAVYSSYVTVAIVSNAFSRSTWCHYEIETAIEARVPIIPVYLSDVDADRFPAILKYIYENNVRIFWPETTDSRKLSKEEISVVRDLAFSVSTYVNQQTANNTRWCKTTDWWNKAVKNTQTCGPGLRRKAAKFWLILPPTHLLDMSHYPPSQIILRADQSYTSNVIIATSKNMFSFYFLQNES